METITLRIKKEECKDTCPIPLQLLPNVQKGIKKVEYNKKKSLAKITYNPKVLNKKQVIDKLKETGWIA